MGDRAEVFRAAVVSSKAVLTPSEQVLLEEACRLIDISDWCAGILTADDSSWGRISNNAGEAELVVSDVVTTARQTSAELRQVVKVLDAPGAKAEPAAPVKSKVDEIAERRKKRRTG